MSDTIQGAMLPTLETARMASALLHERSGTDDDLSRERKLVDATVNEIQHDVLIGPALRRSIRDQRTQVRRHRHDVDRARQDARQRTDAAFERRQEREGSEWRLPMNQPTNTESASALVDERSEADDDLLRERELVDTTAYEIEHGEGVAPSIRAAMHELRARLRSQRKIIDRIRVDARRQTDAAIEKEQTALDGAEVTSSGDRLDARHALWAMLAELDVIASSVQAIRLRSIDLPPEHDLSDLADAIEVASDRVLEVVGNLLDPEDNRSRYHEIGGSG